MANQVSTNYGYIKSVIEQMNDSRHAMQDAITAIRTQIENTVNWQGEDATRYKNTTLDYLDKLWNSSKYMNDMTWKLTMHAETMKNNAEEAAANASYFG